MNECRAMEKWYRQDKLEVSVEKPLPVSFYRPQIPHGPDWNQTLASAVRDRRPTP